MEYRPAFTNNEALWKQFQEELYSWKATEYKWLQVAKGMYADCSTYICQSLVNIKILRQFDFPKTVSRVWFRDPNDDQIFQHMDENFKRYSDSKFSWQFFRVDEEFDSYLKGDIVLFIVRRNIRVFNHAGVYLGNEKMIHNSEGSCVRFSDFDHRWKRVCKGIFRLQEWI